MPLCWVGWCPWYNKLAWLWLTCLKHNGIRSIYKSFTAQVIAECILSSIACAENFWKWNEYHCVLSYTRGTTTLSIMTFTKMTLSIKTFFITIIKPNSEHDDIQYDGKALLCWVSFKFSISSKTISTFPHFYNFSGPKG